MTFDEYQKLAERTMRFDRSRHDFPLQMHDLLMHALLGLPAEVGEVEGVFQKSYQGHPIDERHLKREIGDALWMLAELCTANEWHLDEIAEINIEKLRERYPEGFSKERSLHRREGDV